MEMKRIEAETLEEAYSKAAKELACSVTEINYEIVQHPATGMMGLFKKPAVIIAVKKVVSSGSEPKAKESIKSKNSSITITPKKREKVETGNQPNLDKKVVEVKKTTKVESSIKEKSSLSSLDSISTVVEEKDAIVDGFFNDEANVEVKKTEVKKKEVKKAEVKKKEVKSKEDVTKVETDDFSDSIDSLDFDDDRDSPENKKLSLEIENKLKTLIEAGCFEVDTVEVDVFNGIAHIFVDGEDAALLIGKEGYRYNALSYMLFNWINSSYDLYIKLEIAEFIQTQEEMIDNYLKPIAEHIIEHGRGKTKPLDGILVQIALEKLRAMFPNKYIAIKTGKDGKKFILINNFNSQKPN
jgi:spoIIIJ-associated protein